MSSVKEIATLDGEWKAVEGATAAEKVAGHAVLQGCGGGAVGGVRCGKGAIALAARPGRPHRRARRAGPTKRSGESAEWTRWSASLPPPRWRLPTRRGVTTLVYALNLKTFLAKGKCFQIRAGVRTMNVIDYLLGHSEL